ncbi:ABC transporter permease [Nonomuraea turcica]|uniref:ABC transporter permease n=1 Tax=Nonomuraea sp. G32 TaxID=3067274 RepID=UPI00273B0A83|nr:ABC transporter permease [Nonomuraea sp. G32]MDP4501318.1 ABC transporter permease [Nonomuraea sp. G32]
MNRGEYVVRRSASAAATVAAAVTINFVLFRAAPGDASTQYQMCRTCSAEFRDYLRAELGLDRPLMEQFARYVTALFRGDLGYSFQTRRAVWDELAGPLANTLPMVGVGLALGLGLGLLIGVVAAWRRGTVADWGPLSASMFLSVLPIQWIGLMLLLLFSGTLPTGGVADPYLRFTDPSWWEVLADRLEHMALPSLAIGLAWCGSWALITRSALLGALGEDYVRTARAKGLSSWRIVRRYALPNSMLPITTLIFLTFGYIVAGSLLVETVFSYPGIGLVLYQAVQNRDYAVLQGGFLLLTVSIVLANLLADLLYLRLDPRIRT